MTEALIENISDSRELIKDTEEYPYCCIGLVTGKFDNNFSYGTGFLIGPRIVLTCAHNIYNKKREMEGTNL